MTFFLLTKVGKAGSLDISITAKNQLSLMNNVYHTEHNLQEILSNPVRETLKFKSNAILPAYRNKIWVSRDNLFSLKRMDTKHIFAAIGIIENSGNSNIFHSVDGVAKIGDLKSELNYRKQVIDRIFKHTHMFDMFEKQQYQPCKFLPNLTTKGIYVR